MMILLKLEDKEIIATKFSEEIKVMNKGNKCVNKNQDQSILVKAFCNKNQ